MSSEKEQLLSPDQSHNVSVKFCVYTAEGSCYTCCSCCPCGDCCAPSREDATQIVVPDTTTVDEFLRIVTRMNNPKTEYTAAFIDQYQLRGSDLVAPTVRSFEKFASPVLIVPKGRNNCCLLV